MNSAAPLVLVGAGRMGAALLTGWSKQGLERPIVVVEPAPSPELDALCRAEGFALNPARLPEAAGILVLAVKPQMLDEAAPKLASMVGPDTLVVSILAGKRIANLSARLPGAQAIVRAMPNTPAAIGHGITGLVASPAATSAQRDEAQRLVEAVGEAVWLPDESLMDAVTAVSGSGPAYLFLLCEALAAAGEEAGLPGEIAAKLARATVAGSAALLQASPDLNPTSLRQNVTSPGGTTEAALSVLMAQDGLPALMRKAVAAAVARGRDLAG